MTDARTVAVGSNDYEHNYCRVCGRSLVHDRTELSRDNTIIYYFYVCPNVRFGGGHDRKVIGEGIPNEQVTV